MSEPLYKWLNGREATHVPGFRYRLRAWMPAVGGPIVACKNGYHLNRVPDLPYYIARDLFVAEYDGDRLDCSDKVVVRRARIVEHLKGWNRTAVVLCAADFAEHVLPLFERRFPGDDRPRRAIETARFGDAADAARAAAAWAADAGAADAAAWAARTAAARTAWAAADAATWAAGAATWAAGAAGNSEAAAEAEREWQGRRILDYAYGRLP